ncbi:hypothetical protein ACWENS_05555 [Streptomyces sp. NPDC004532]
MLRPRANSIALGKAAYKAYAASTDNKNVRGEALPAWEQLGPAVQSAWQLAAEAVRHEVEICL